MARHGAEGFMSKSTIALIITWVIIGLVGAFLGGYFWAKKNVCKLDDKSGENVLIDNTNSNNDIPTSKSDSSTSSSNDANKTVVQPIEQK